jgi:hypothetical protein
MNESDADELIREKYQRNSPAVDVDVAWEMLRTRMAETEWPEESQGGRPAIRPVSIGDERRQSSATKVVAQRASVSGRKSGLRVAVYACVAIVLAAGITVGSLEAVKHLGEERPILVIGDDTAGISPGSTGPVTATTMVSVQTTTSATPSAAVSPPTTDSPYPLETRLPNGHFRGLVFITYLGFMDVMDGYRGIDVDYLELLTGEEAKAAAVEDGAISPGEDLPHDYYVRNPTTPAEEEAGEGEYGPSFVVYETASITTYTFGDGGEQAITWDQLVSFWHPTSPPEGGEHMRDVPWWIERDERGCVVSITECVLP